MVRLVLRDPRGLDKAQGTESVIHQRYMVKRRRTVYPEEGSRKFLLKSQLLRFLELSFLDKVGDCIMATSPYHIASLLDKVRRGKVSFFAAIVACAIRYVFASR